MAVKRKIRLKGHESFYLREGWLNKGIALVHENARVFSKNYGADDLGVGTNMAKSIRYWLKAAGLIVESSKVGAKLSDVGEMIYEFDPFFEDDFSIWLIHIRLSANKELCTSWYLFFNELELEEFSKDELYLTLGRRLETKMNVETYSKRSLMDDCMVLLHMYAKKKKEDYDPEDKKICPFTKLGLVRRNGEKFRKTQPNLVNLDSMLIFYLIQDYFTKYEKNSVSIDEIEKGKNMPGKLMNLSRVAIYEYLDILADSGYVTVNRTAGLDMVYRNTDISKEEAIQRYYKSNK